MCSRWARRRSLSTLPPPHPPGTKRVSPPSWDLGCVLPDHQTPKKAQPAPHSTRSFTCPGKMLFWRQEGFILTQDLSGKYINFLPGREDSSQKAVTVFSTELYLGISGWPHSPALTVKMLGSRRRPTRPKRLKAHPPPMRTLKTYQATIWRARTEGR